MKIGCFVLIGLVVLSVIGSVLLNILVPFDEEAAEAQFPGYKNFNIADDLVDTDDEGIAHGNSPIAADMAQSFAELMKVQREMFITGEDNTVLSLSGGNFLTYCLLTDEACVYLMHIPGLRDYEDEAKDFMVEVAFNTGNTILMASGEELPPKLIVVAQGLFSTYKRVSGTPGPDAEITDDTLEVTDLYIYFKDLETVQVKPGQTDFSMEAEAEVLPEGEDEAETEAPAPDPSASTLPESTPAVESPAPASEEMATSAPDPAPAAVSTASAPEPETAPMVEAKHWRTWVGGNGESMRGKFIGIRENQDGSESLGISRDGEEKKFYSIDQFSVADVAYARAVMKGEEPVQDGAWLTAKVAAGETPELSAPPEIREMRSWTTKSGNTTQAKLVGLVDNGSVLQVALLQQSGQVMGVAIGDLSAEDKQYIEDVKKGVEP